MDAFKNCVVCVPLILAASIVLALPPGWIDDVRLTNNPSFSVAPSIASDGTNFHVVWEDSRDGNREIYYKKITDSGQVLVNDLRLTDNPLDSRFPDVIVDGLGFVHVVWQDHRDGNYEIYYKKLTNAGMPVTADLRITFAPSHSERPVIAVDAWNNLHLAWQDNRAANIIYPFQYRIYYEKLDNNGAPLTGQIWLDEMVVRNSYLPDIDVDRAGNVHVVWATDLLPFLVVEYKKLYGNSTLVSNLQYVAYYPSSGPFYSSSAPTVVTDDDLYIHFAWVSNRNGNTEIYYSKWRNVSTINNTGEVIIDQIRITNNPWSSGVTNAQGPKLGINALYQPYFLWPDNRNGSFEVYYKEIYQPDIQLTLAAGSAESIALATGNTVPYIVWADYRSDPNGDIYFKHKESEYPVILVHGIYSDDTIWNEIEPVLQNAGFTVYRLGNVIGQSGFVPNNGDMTILTQQLKDAIDEVKLQTGKPKVDIVAHSMGGLVARQYIRSAAYQYDIDRLITLGTPNEGTQFANSPLAAQFGAQLAGSQADPDDTARLQMIPGSAFLRTLNENFNNNGVMHTEIAGTLVSPQIINLLNQIRSEMSSVAWMTLRYGIIHNQVQAAIAEGGSDTIVPVNSVNIPEIACYEAYVSHNAFLGPAYYNTNSVISAITSLLAGQSPNLAPCGVTDSLNETAGNNIISKSYSGFTANANYTALFSSNFLVVANHSGMQLSLISPSGAIFNATSGNIIYNTTYQNGTFQDWFMGLNQQPGNWTIVLRSPTTDYYDLSWFTESNASIALASPSVSYLPDSPVPLQATFQLGMSPMLNGSVMATVLKPDNASGTVALLDDGFHGDGLPNDGIYGNSFPNTSISGHYVVLVNATKADVELYDLFTFFIEYLPDIAVTNLSFIPPFLPPFANTTLLINVSLRNYGAAIANSTVFFYNGSLNSPAFSSVSIPYFAENSSQNIAVPYFVLANTTPVIYVRVGEVPGSLESNYSNNIAFKATELAPQLVTCGAALSINTLLHNDLINCSWKGLLIINPGITLDCNNHSIVGNPASVAGIDGMGMQNVTVKNCIVSGFYIGISDLYAGSLIANSIINNSFVGISVFGEGTSLMNSTIRNTTNAGGLTADNSLVMNNLFVDNYYGFIYYGSNTLFAHNQVRNTANSPGLRVSPGVNVSVLNNTFDNNPGGIEIRGAEKIFVGYNEIRNTFGTGIYSDRMGNSNCREGRFFFNSFNKSVNGIFLQNCDNMTIRSNRMINMSTSGITVAANSSNILVDSDVVQGSYIGIDVRGFQNNVNITVKNNVINSTDTGLKFGGNLSVIINNTLQNNSFGIRASGSNNSYRLNTANMNDYGIFLQYSDDNQFSSNQISNSAAIGIYLQYANRNYFYNNNLDNPTNAWEYQSINNSWNLSTVGNLWSDFLSNPGYPSTYIIPGPGEGVDYHPLNEIIVPMQNITWLAPSSLTNNLSQPVSNASSIRQYALTKDSKDNLHLIYYRYNQTDISLFYKKFDRYGNMLIDDKRIGDVILYNLSEMSADIDSADNIHVAFSTYDPGSFGFSPYYTKLNNSGDTLINDTPIFSCQTCFRPVLKVDSLDNINVLNQKFSGPLFSTYYTKLNNSGNIMIHSILTNSVWVSDLPAMTVDNNNDVEIVTNLYTSTPPSYSQNLHYFKLNSSGGIIINGTIIHSLPGTLLSISPFTSLDHDSQNNLYLTWTAYWNASNIGIYYTKLANNGTIIVNGTILANGSYSEIVVDKKDKIHLAWSGQGLKYAELTQNGSILRNSTVPSVFGAYMPRIVTNSSDIHIVSATNLEGNIIYYTRNTPDSGLLVRGQPRIGSRMNFTYLDNHHPASSYLAALSLGTSPGLPLSDGRVIPLNYDQALAYSIDPVIAPAIGLQNTWGILANGQANGTWNIPYIPQLVNLTVYTAFVTVNASKPFPGSFEYISPAVPITFQP